MWHRLGIRTFILHIFKGFLPGLFLLIISLLVLSLKNLILGSFSGTINFQNTNISEIILAVAGGAAVISFPIMAFGVIINVFRYFSFRYALEEDVLRIHKGIISRDEVSIPYSKIEDIDLEQSIFYRIIGVSKLFVITGGREQKGAGLDTGETEIIFDAIDFSKGKYLQKELPGRGGIQKVHNV